MKLIFAIAIGGAIGALGRHFLAYFVMSLTGPGFPWGVVVVNILGSFLMGCLVEISAILWAPTMEMRAFLMVGILGAFTTFSTFALDIILLMQRGEFLLTGGYILISVLCAVAALLSGMALVRMAIV